MSKSVKNKASQLILDPDLTHLYFNIVTKMQNDRAIIIKLLVILKLPESR